MKSPLECADYVVDRIESRIESHLRPILVIESINENTTPFLKFNNVKKNPEIQNQLSRSW